MKIYLRFFDHKAEIAENVNSVQVVEDSNVNLYIDEEEYHPYIVYAGFDGKVRTYLNVMDLEVF